jgi:hypothetical protein
MGIPLDRLAMIALAGPFFGLLVAGVCGVLALVWHSPLFSALAHVGAWLNVLNLVPVLGLDGAQATYALDRTQRWLVLATALIFFGMLKEWVFLFVAIGLCRSAKQQNHGALCPAAVRARRNQLSFPGDGRTVLAWPTEALQGSSAELKLLPCASFALTTGVMPVIGQSIARAGSSHRMHRSPAG